MVLVISTDNTREPRMQVSEGLETQRMFGADVEGARSVTIDAGAVGYPLPSLDQSRPANTTCRRCSTCMRRSNAPTATP